MGFLMIIRKWALRDKIRGSQPGTQLSPVSEAASARLSETLRDVFAADRESIVAQLNSLRHRNREDRQKRKGPDMPPAPA